MLRPIAVLRPLLAVFWLSAVAPADDRPLAVDVLPVVLRPAEPLPALLNVFNSNLLAATAFQGERYDGPPFETAVRALRPTGLRFPGGSIANNFLWQQDSFSEPTDDRTGWAGEQIRLFRKIGRPYDLPGYARVCRQFGLTPVWVLNVYEETPESVTALLAHLDMLGLSVRHIEMANEPYWDGRSDRSVQPYLDACRPLAAAIKRANPDMQIGACFAPLGNPANYESWWNGPLAAEDWYDAVVYHEYYGGQGFVLEKGETLPAAAMLRPEAFLDVPTAAYAALAPGKPLWLTEWNIGAEGIGHWKDKGAELLFLGACFARLVEHRDTIELACFHQFHDTHFGTFRWEPNAGRFETAASFEFFRLLGLAFAPADRLRPVTFPTEDVVGFATQGAAGLRLFAVNRGGTDRRLALPPEFDGRLVRLSIACPPDQPLPASRPLTRETAVTGGVVSLPAYSVSLIGPPTLPPAGVETTGEAENLFPRRPQLMLWHEPYAATQPRFDAAGVYEVDTAAFRDKPLAVIKLDLSGLGLEAGRAYRIDFEARADPEGGIVLVAPPMPDGAAGEKAFAPLGRDYAWHRLMVHGGADGTTEAVFVIGQDVIARGGKVALRSFRIAPAE